MSEEKYVKDPVVTAIREQIKRVTSKIGNLHLHINGESKLDFFVGKTPSLTPMYSIIISGDNGCLHPYDEQEDNCALDEALLILRSVKVVPHLNSSEFEKYVVSPEEWAKWIDDIEDDFKEHARLGQYLHKYDFSLNKLVDGVNVTVATINIQPIVTEFVIGEITAADKATLIGIIDDFDKPKIKSVIVTVNNEDIEIEDDKILVYRNKRRFQPGKGDYLLKDVESEVYYILPGEDYSIH